jgi:FAD:protein FMN transferase
VRVHYNRRTTIDQLRYWLDTLKILITGVLCVALSVSSTGPVWYERDQPAGLARLEVTEDAMGSSFSLVLFGPDRRRLESAAAAAFAEAHRLDRLLSNYLAGSEWTAMNREAAGRPVHVTPELFALLSNCLEYSRISDGAFDITVGPLMQVWGFYRGEGGLPHANEVKDALNRVGYRHVQLDPGPRTVRFARPGMDLDPGGIGKGYAVDRMVDVLKQAGVRIALVSASGSSIYGLGTPPDAPQGWPIAIRTPRDPSAIATHVFLENMSLSTSGSYEKFFWADGRTYSHIFDPRTGYPARGTSAVSVLAPRTIDSEAWTKPFFINGRAWASAHKPAGFRVFVCDDRPHPTCAWLE